MAAFNMATSSFLITILPETVATRITESLPSASSHCCHNCKAVQKWGPLEPYARETISPAGCLGSRRSRSASNGARGSQRICPNGVETGHQPRSRDCGSSKWRITPLSPSSMHVCESNKKPMSNKTRCERPHVSIPGRPSRLGSAWTSSNSRIDCGDRSGWTISDY